MPESTASQRSWRRVLLRGCFLGLSVALHKHHDVDELVAFFKALKAYAQEYPWKSVNTDDFR